VRLAIRFPLMKNLGYGGWATRARWGLLVAYRTSAACTPCKSP
jgi:hypothetical protein